VIFIEIILGLKILIIIAKILMVSVILSYQ